MTPKTAMPSMMRLVAIGRRIKKSEIFIVDLISDTCTDRSTLTTVRTSNCFLLTSKLLSSDFLLHLGNSDVEAQLDVEIGPVELRAHGLLDVGAALLLQHELVHAVPEPQCPVAEL